MREDIKLPEVAEGVKSGTVVALLVAAGDRVEADQTLLELETDKAVVPIPAPRAGIIGEILVAEGDSVSVGQSLMALESDEAQGAGPDAADEAAKQEKSQPVKSEKKPVPESEPKSEKQAEPASEPEPAAKLRSIEPVDKPSDSDPAGSFQPLTGEQQVAPAAPSVRRLARELGVDIHRVEGSGPRGRINAADINEFVKMTLQAQGGGEGGGRQPLPLPDFSRFGEVRREKLTRIRELTAESMGRAWAHIPMVTQFDKAAVGSVEDFRRQFNQGTQTPTRLTMTAILVKVCAAALQAFPQFNSVLDLPHGELIFQQYINIGVAVDTPNGLLVPVLRQPEAKGLVKIATELNELAELSRTRKVKPQQLEGGTFTISNLGGIGGTAFTPIVYPPQVAILGVAASEMQPVWNGKEFTPQLILPLCLTYDHRVIDGADGARFLRWICQALENPLQLVL
jgi:pyruvate dehydrogenase E2 component (dihydrolipoamide acetyltransferase)